ncbi:glycosyltransferase family 2 protein [Polynucleobacter sp.]|uniref:glycosyltransferase family 2 protein n=1 Tax=Polynucleobacter sp. TaxID=2029855 RepID=UPI003F69F761
MKSIVESVSIVIPAYQESAAIGYVVSAVLKVAASLSCEYEVIVVDDGSSDGTGDKARKAGAYVLTHPYNKGYGASLKTGIRFASNRTVIFLDADGQHDPDDIPHLLAERIGFDMVVGARKGMAGSPLWRQPGKLFLKWLVNNLTGHSIPDFNSGYRALDREMALRFLPIMPNGFSFSTTSTIAAFKGGYLVQYLPIQVAKRIGTSTVTAADGFRTIMLIIRLVTLFAPLRVFLPISMLTFFIGLIFTVNGYVFAGEASVKGLIALLAAVQFFLFGIMVDQVVAVRRGEVIQ